MMTEAQTCARASLWRYPERDNKSWRLLFEESMAPALRPGCRILDVGSGRKPSLRVDQRPPGCYYVGLDISDDELQQAPAGSYDEVWVRDVSQRVPELEGQFDLVVSWQVLEHVRPLTVVLSNLHAYLQPNGSLVAVLSGRFSVFGLINTLIPHRLGVQILHRLLGRDPDTVFPAFYDRCWYGALRSELRPWTESDVIPVYRGGSYWSFSKVLQAIYLLYEDWACKGNHRNLATHYLIWARR